MALQRAALEASSAAAMALPRGATSGPLDLVALLGESLDAFNYGAPPYGDTPCGTHYVAGGPCGYAGASPPCLRTNPPGLHTELSWASSCCTVRSPQLGESSPTSRTASAPSSPSSPTLLGIPSAGGSSHPEVSSISSISLDDLDSTISHVLLDEQCGLAPFGYTIE